MRVVQKILCLDLATQFGWAKRSETGEIKYGSHLLPKTGRDVAAFLIIYEEFIGPMIAAHDITVFEMPWIGPKTHQYTARKLIGLANTTEVIAKKSQSQAFEANNSNVRSCFLGPITYPITLKGKDKGKERRKYLKAVTIAKCVKLGYAPENDDEADALALLHYTLTMYRLLPGAEGPLFGGVA